MNQGQHAKANIDHASKSLFSLPILCLKQMRYTSVYIEMFVSAISAYKAV